MFFSKKKPAKRANASTARSNKSKKTNNGIIGRLNLSRRESQFILFILVFSLLGGGYYAYRSYAATPLCRERILRQGSSDSTCVRYLQEVLKLNGYDPGGVDGIYGSRTTAAVRAFQASPQRGGYGTRDQLVADGIAGPKTGLHLCAFFGSHPYCSSRPGSTSSSSGSTNKSVSGSTKIVSSSSNKGAPVSSGSKGGSPVVRISGCTISGNLGQRTGHGWYVAAFSSNRMRGSDYSLNSSNGAFSFRVRGVWGSSTLSVRYNTGGGYINIGSVRTSRSCF